MNQQVEAMKARVESLSDEERNAIVECLTLLGPMITEAGKAIVNAKRLFRVASKNQVLVAEPEVAGRIFQNGQATQLKVNDPAAQVKQAAQQNAANAAGMLVGIFNLANELGAVIDGKTQGAA